MSLVENGKKKKLEMEQENGKWEIRAEEKGWRFTLFKNL